MNKFILVLSLLIYAGTTNAIQFCRANITLSAPDERFIVNSDGTVTDLEIGVMWQRCVVGTNGANCELGSETQFTWANALKHAADLNSSGGFASYTDWRVPNINEISSLAEVACQDPSLNTNVFPIQLEWTLNWSSTPSDSFYGGVKDRVWLSNFAGGNFSINGFGGRSDSYSLRLVRGGN